LLLLLADPGFDGDERGVVFEGDDRGVTDEELSEPPVM
jgi:hypothetical protein